MYFIKEMYAKIMMLMKVDDLPSLMGTRLIIIKL